MNVTTPYHFSDCVQGMGCLFWADFQSELRENFSDHEALVLFLIQFRKYVNYFVEQSLINGLWGSFQHDVIAVASILIARFEMKSISKIRWKRKAFTPKLQFNSTWNPNLKAYLTAKLSLLKDCMMEIYRIVFDGAEFPFMSEIEEQIYEPRTDLVSKGRDILQLSSQMEKQAHSYDRTSLRTKRKKTKERSEAISIF
mmetsp:Transcript_9714/g.14795  ORF Transcript_9714/g.14795 Transcript_9714/m.14795 type:complete len:198 (-) Transcript_9714:1591-2184(-)